MSSLDPQGKSFNLLQFSPCVWIESKHKKEYTICICIHVDSLKGFGIIFNWDISTTHPLP